MFDIVADGSVCLHTASTEHEAIRWAKAYISRENAGNYDVITINPVPFNDDFVWSWDRADI